MQFSNHWDKKDITFLTKMVKLQLATLTNMVIL